MVKAEKCLDDLKKGERGRIRGISLPADYEQRLAELGFLPGADVEIVHIAPLGDPIAVECQGRRLGMRRSDARGIFIE
jgi:Fe2+ transport system protein FeoA